MSLALLGAGPAVDEPPVDYITRWGAVAHWKLDAASGNETDVISAQALVATNTPGSAAGIVNTSRQFNSANSRRFTLSDNATMSTGDIDFWASCWVYADSLAALATPMGKGTGGSEEWGFRYDQPTNRMHFRIRVNPAGTIIAVPADTFGALSTATWYFLVGYHDAVSNLVGISINGGAFDTLTTSGGAPGDLTGAFNVGAHPSASLFWDGRIDEHTFGKSPALGIAALATEIRDRLYNSGAGRAYPWS